MFFPTKRKKPLTPEENIQLLQLLGALAVVSMVLYLIFSMLAFFNL